MLAKIEPEYQCFKGQGVKFLTFFEKGQEFQCLKE